jgi:L,D-transpeptidase YcbB
MAQSAVPFTCNSITLSDLCTFIEAGQLNDLRWPNFSDVRTDVRDFYLPVDYALGWTKDGQPTSQARSLIRLLENADKKGLRPEDYDGPLWDIRIARLVPSAPRASPSELARFDLALTVSVMRYISALHNGRVNPHRLQLGLNIEHKRYKLAEFVRSRLTGAQDVSSLMDQVEPPYAGYRRTESALQRYLALAQAGEGEPLPLFKKPIKPGDTFEGLPQLTLRLQRLGELPQAAPAPNQGRTYGGAVVESVKHFQGRHGLSTNGLIDQATFNQLTTPLSRRIIQLQLTLERWRWLPPDLPRSLIAVNVPEFQLRAYDDHHPSVTMRVVVGKAFPEHQTPVFQDEMEYLIFRPYWNVPISITRKELIPAIRKDPDYLEKHGFELINRKGQIMAADVKDSAVLASLRSGEFEIRQKPGSGNALGMIKFVFPNNYDVYLHGTPESALFSRASRAFSHGCIRVEDPATLAAWVLKDDPSWTTERIRSAMNSNESLRVNLPTPIAVLVLYGTAIVEENGDVHFLQDIYGQDAKLVRALAGGYPYPPYAGIRIGGK